MSGISRLPPDPVRVLYATVGTNHGVFDTHALRRGMPGWAVHRYDYAELRTRTTRVLHARTMQFTTKAKQDKTRCNMSYLFEACCVMLLYLT